MMTEFMLEWKRDFDFMMFIKWTYMIWRHIITVYYVIRFLNIYFVFVLHKVKDNYFSVYLRDNSLSLLNDCIYYTTFVLKPVRTLLNNGKGIGKGTLVV